MKSHNFTVISAFTILTLQYLLPAYFTVTVNVPFLVCFGDFKGCLTFGIGFFVAYAFLLISCTVSNFSCTCSANC